MEELEKESGPVRKAIEGEIRTVGRQANWCCAAVIRDSKNTERVKIVCRDEPELNRVKEQPRRSQQRESEYCETNCTQSKWTMPTERPFSIKTERFYPGLPKFLRRETTFTLPRSDGSAGRTRERHTGQWYMSQKVAKRHDYCKINISMLQGNQPTPGSLNDDTAHSHATDHALLDVSSTSRYLIVLVPGIGMISCWIRRYTGQNALNW